jgi:hypothetical protein
MTSDDFLIDKRTVDRHIKDGKLDAAEYRRMLDALPDRSASVWRGPAASEVAAVTASADDARTGLAHSDVSEVLSAE